MTPAQIHRTLVTAFTRLPPAQRRNLGEHAKRQTPCCCGETAGYYFIDGAG